MITTPRHGRVRSTSTANSFIPTAPRHIYFGGRRRAECYRLRWQSGGDHTGHRGRPPVVRSRSISSPLPSETGSGVSPIGFVGGCPPPVPYAHGVVRVSVLRIAKTAEPEPSGVMPQAEAGHQTRVTYRWEDNGFAQEPSSSTVHTPGADAQLSTAEGRNNLMRVFKPGSREAVDLLEMHFEGSFALQFTMTNPWWLQSILGSMSSSGTAAPYSYSFSAGGTPKSFSITEGYEEADAERSLRGCVVTSMSVEVSVEDAVRVTLEGMYAEEETETDLGSLTAQANTQLDVLTFVDASLSIGGTTEGYVQDMSLSVEANADPIREMGTRFPIDFNPKALEPSVDFGAIRHGETDGLADMYGTSSFSSGVNTQSERLENMVALNMEFDNGKSGSELNSATFNVSGTLPESYGESGIGDPRADLEQTINRVGQGVTVIAENGTDVSAL